MSAYKKIAGDYNIVTVDPVTGSRASESNVKVETHTLIVEGNLSVMGETTMIDVTETTIQDPFIVLGSTDSPTVFTQVGIIAQTAQWDGSSFDNQPFAGLRFNRDSGFWEISVDVDLEGEDVTDPYRPLATLDDLGNVSGNIQNPGGPIGSVQYNLDDEQFGGSADFVYDAANATVRIDGYQLLVEQASSPTAEANTVTVFNQPPALGDSGVYFVGTDNSDELVAYRRARKLALIL